MYQLYNYTIVFCSVTHHTITSNKWATYIAVIDWIFRLLLLPVKIYAAYYLYVINCCCGACTCAMDGELIDFLPQMK